EASAIPIASAVVAMPWISRVESAMAVMSAPLGVVVLRLSVLMRSTPVAAVPACRENPLLQGLRSKCARGARDAAALACRPRRPSGAPGTERLHHCLVGFEARAADQGAAVGTGREYRFEVLADRLGPARKIHDQRAAADAGGLSRQDGGGDILQRRGAHQLAEAGHLALDHLQRGLGCHVARCGTGAAGGHDQAAA